MYIYALIQWKRFAFRVENFFNFALWMNKIRSPASYTRKLLRLFCREKFCLKTIYSGIELICEFAKTWLIITKTCFDNFLLFLLLWLLWLKFLRDNLTRTSSSFAKCSARTFKFESVFSDCQQIVEKGLFRCLLCWNASKIFTNVRQKATNIMCVSFT